MRFMICMLLIPSIFVVSCTAVHQLPVNSTTPDDTGVASAQELYQFPNWANGCDRFRPIFERELAKYPLLHRDFDLPLLYSLIYQETLCQTRDEFKTYLEENNRLIDDGWKGGIMQVDSCWRWGAPHDCSTIQNQIALGVGELNASYSKIYDILTDLHLDKNLSRDQKLTLLFLAYNRGYYVSNQAMQIYRHTLDAHDFSLEPFATETGSTIIVHVNCTEKDVCMDDFQDIDVTDELKEQPNDFERSLLISCRKNYGTMHNAQGDYCTGPGYGLKYPEWIFGIHDKILDYQSKGILDTSQEKEFYIGQLNFSGYAWFIKTAYGKTYPGPNHFDDHSYVDQQGYLHMALAQRNGSWYASEVVLTDQLGYGDYSFLVGGDISNLSENAVLGLFLYDLTNSHGANDAHREIDVEMATWGNALENNTQFTVQGFPSAMDRFTIHSTEDILFSFHWSPDGVDFQAREGNSTGPVLRQWTYRGNLTPTPGDEHARINLWLQGTNATLNKDVDVVIKKFEKS